MEVLEILLYGAYVSLLVFISIVALLSYLNRGLEIENARLKKQIELEVLRGELNLAKAMGKEK
jgi:hypothetical protein